MNNDVANTFKEKLLQREFTITLNLTASKIVDTDINLEYLKEQKDNLDAILISSNPESIGISGLALITPLINLSITPILSITTRDSNRFNIASTLLGGFSLGLRNTLATSGYHTSVRNFHDVRGVYDIDTLGLVMMVAKINSEGELPDGTHINGKFDFFQGITANFTSEPEELHKIHLLKKLSCGAKFVITQPIFSPGQFKNWNNTTGDNVRENGAYIIASVTPAFTTKQLLDLRERHPYLNISDETINRLKDAGDDPEKYLIFNKEIIEEIKSIEGISGIHFHTSEWSPQIPDLLKYARMK